MKNSRINQLSVVPFNTANKTNLATNSHTAIEPPKCEPACGTNSHCEYGLTESKCVCNPGTSGNPYHGCGVQEKSDCSDASCGIGAQCSTGPNAVECVCPPGYAGNPYIQCYGKYTNTTLSTKAYSFVTVCFTTNTINSFELTFAKLTLTATVAETSYREMGKRGSVTMRKDYVFSIA